MNTVIVRAGDCPCPGTPHTEETVTLEPEATIHMSLLAFRMLRAAEGTIEAKLAALVASYIPMCITGWTFLETDPAGKLVTAPVTKENAERLIPWDKGGYEVADAADSLYSGRVTAPLVRRMRLSSPIGQTDDSMSPNPTSGSQPPTPLVRSSRSGSAGRPFVDPAQ